jgi:hypothetical protein
MEHLVEWQLSNDTELLWENLPSATLPITYVTWFDWDRTGVAAEGSRRLTAWAGARPCGLLADNRRLMLESRSIDILKSPVWLEKSSLTAPREACRPQTFVCMHLVVSMLQHVAYSCIEMIRYLCAVSLKLSGLYATWIRSPSCGVQSSTDLAPWYIILVERLRKSFMVIATTNVFVVFISTAHHHNPIPYSRLQCKFSLISNQMRVVI